MNPDEVERIALLARLMLSEPEKQRFADQLTSVLDHFQKLREVATEGTPPAAHPADLTGPLREDRPAPDPRAAEIRRLSQGARDAFFEVPRILDA